jgi:hypothetical protein
MEGAPGNLHVKYLERWHGLKWLGSPVQLDLADFAFDPALASNSRGDLIAVWKQAVGSRSQLAAAFKPAGGAWTPPQLLRDGPSLATGPTLTTDSQNRFYVAWSERDSQLREHVRVQIYRSGQGWDPNSTQISGDSVTTQPVLTTDTIDRIHLAYLLVSSGPGAVRNLMHTFYPFSGDWSPPVGPLAFGTGISQPMLAPMDSSRIALAWRETRGPVENIYFRIFDRTSWQSALGPAAVVAPSGWPASIDRKSVV